MEVWDSLEKRLVTWDRDHKYPSLKGCILAQLPISQGEKEVGGGAV